MGGGGGGGGGARMQSNICSWLPPRVDDILHSPSGGVVTIRKIAGIPSHLYA